MKKQQMLIKSLVGVGLGMMIAQEGRSSSVETMARLSQSGGLIARQIQSQNDNHAKWCAGPSAGKKQIEAGRNEIAKLYRTHEAISFARIGVFLSSYAYTFVPKGTVSVGDEVTFRAAPIETALPEIKCHRLNREVLVVDKIIKHHTGSLLYANGKFLDKIPADGEQPKAESKPKPKSNPVLDL